MELKLLLLIIFISKSTQRTVETENVEENDQPLYNDDDFLDDIDEDLDYFYTYEAIKNLQTVISKPADGSNTTVDLAERFFLNFLTEDEYEEEDYEDYEYEDAMDDLAGSESSDTDTYNYTELDQIEQDDFVYFGTLEDFVGQSSRGSGVSRDTVLMVTLAAVLVLVLVFLLLLFYLRSRRQDCETGVRPEQEEIQVGGDDLLKETV